MDKKATMALKPDTVNQVHKLRKIFCSELFRLVRKEIRQNNHLPRRGEDGPYVCAESPTIKWRLYEKVGKHGAEGGTWLQIPIEWGFA